MTLTSPGLQPRLSPARTYVWFANSALAQHAVNTLEEVTPPVLRHLGANEPLDGNTRMVVVEPQLQSQVSQRPSTTVPLAGPRGIWTYAGHSILVVARGIRGPVLGGIVEGRVEWHVRVDELGRDARVGRRELVEVAGDELVEAGNGADELLPAALQHGGCLVDRYVQGKGIVSF